MMGDARKIKIRLQMPRNDRGVALLIVLLVTALLIALIFEFSYATRISLNSAINFRNSQRAYFLARSGIFAYIKYGATLRKFIQPGVWSDVPGLSEPDTRIMFMWEDESGKIKITNVKYEPTLSMARGLFENVKHLDTAVVNNLVDQFSDVSKLSILSVLRQYLSDEDFDKVKDSLTVSNVNQNVININAAPRDVLLSLGIVSGDVERIVEERKTAPSRELSNVPGIGNLQINGLALSTYLTTTEGTIFKVSATANVGDYEKHIEAVINGNVISYWRAL